MSEPQVRPNPIIGLYDGPLWEYAKRQELRLQRCSDCGEFRYPPGPALFQVPVGELLMDAA